jgi:hypothetical protein
METKDKRHYFNHFFPINLLFWGTNFIFFNKKFFGGPGGDFSKKSPGRRRQRNYRQLLVFGYRQDPIPVNFAHQKEQDE